jgi:glucosylceramidase
MDALLTSAAGDAQRVVSLADLAPPAPPAAPPLRVREDRPRQNLWGVGSSLTQASASALTSLTPSARAEVLRRAFAPDEAAFSLVRTHIGSCDFSTSSYCYAPEPDPALRGFSLDVDRGNGLLDLLRDARDVPGAAFRLIASPWTAPPWMKDNGRFHEPEARRGGRLLPEHHETFALYTARYVEEMAAEGLDIWALTPVNEPHGNQGTWESMEMDPPEQAAYVATLGRVLAERGLSPRILVYDQNRKGMQEFADGVFSDPAAASHAWGTAVHWYDSTFRVYEDELEALHAAWPDRPIIQTEGCIDNVFSHGEDKGPDAPTPWWRDDGWYWRKVATDWGWDWAPDPEVDHPPYAAAFRYARDLVGGLAHRLAGWVDWNLVLDRHGGPNHVGNFCLAPILVDGDAVYVTPLFHVLSQVSRTAPPGAVVLTLEGALPVGLWAVAIRAPDGTRAVHLFNETEASIDVPLSWGEDAVSVRCPACALLTLRLG